jgi:hypothetical protein
MDEYIYQCRETISNGAPNKRDIVAKDDEDEKSD